jgi:hypothetical protein
MLTDDEIRALLAGCEGVTPGPWQLLGWGPMGLYGKGDLRDAEYIARFRADLIEDGNAAHIARCDPTTIAELCTRLLSAEAEAETLRRNNDVLRADLLDVMRDRDEAQARVKVLEDALRRIANTTEGDADLDEYGSAEVARAALQEQSK